MPTNVIKYAFTTTAAKMLRMADNLNIAMGHFIEGKHYASLPPETPIHIWRGTTYNSVRGCGDKYFQSFDGVIPPEPFCYDYAFQAYNKVKKVYPLIRPCRPCR
jgi:hypothetical protein